MIHYTHNRKSRPYRPFVALVCAFILLFSIGFGIFGISGPKTAEATNPYVSNIKFLEEEGTGYFVVEFFVNTTFVLDHDYPDYLVDASIYMKGLKPDNSLEITGWIWQYDKAGTDNPLTYTAGNTYKNYIFSARQLYRIYPESGFRYNTTNYQINAGSYIDKLGNTEYYPTWAEPMTPSWIENDDIYYIETPTLDITFPLPNAEIAEAFDITGTYTIPSLADYYLLVFELQYEDADMIWAYKADLIAPAGSFSVRVAGLPTANYTIRPHFFGALGWYYIPDEIAISIVDSIPIELPDTQEIPPEQFGVVRGLPFYPEHSNYPDPTNLYENLIATIEPVIIVIGDNLTFFSSRFSQDVAKETGSKTGEAVLLMRAYSSNLNSFFSDLPISEFLFFYLILLVVVIVFRIIKNLINLVKP